MGGLQPSRDDVPEPLLAIQQGIPLLPKADFNQVLERLMKWLPIPFALEH